jgi:hypothetical protein
MEASDRSYELLFVFAGVEQAVAAVSKVGLGRWAMDMNWKRVINFTALLFVATGAAAFLFGAIRGFLQGIGRPPLSWLPLAQGVAVPLAAVCVFVALAKRQDEQVWKHGSAVVALAGFLSYPINVLLFGVTVPAWAVGIVIMFICLGVGIPIGRRLARSGSNESAAQRAAAVDPPEP